MAFSLVHFNLHLFLKSTKGVNFDVWSRYNPPYNAAIDMDYSFAKDSSPSDTPITIHGLEHKHAKLFTKGSLVTVFAGWSNSDGSKNNYSEIFSEKIKEDANTTNIGGDIQTNFTCTDGLSDGKEESLSKIRSKGIRADASASSELSGAERRALNKVKKRFGIKSNNLNVIKNKIRKERSKLGPDERAAKARIMKDHPDRHGGGRKSGDGQYNHEQVVIRKSLRDKTTKYYQALRKQLKAADDATIKRRHRYVKSRERSERHIRTQYQAKRKRAKSSKSKRKSKSIKRKNGLHFKKGTRASAIIKSLARRAHIKIAKIDLGRSDKKYTAGYTADKTPRQCIQDIVNDCNKQIWFEHGKRVIGDFAKHTPVNFVLESSTGLMNPPQEQEDDDDNSSVPTYSVDCIFLPFVTAGSEFPIIDPEDSLIDEVDHKEPINRGDYFNGMAVVESGDLEVNSGDTPMAHLTVVKASQQKAYEKSTANKKKAKASRIKNRRDARSRHRVRAKRKARQHARMQRKRA